MNKPPEIHKPTIVLIDDEEIVTQSLGSFLELESKYNVVTFQAPQKALDHIKLNPPDIIISDFLMPNMNGLQLLTKVKEIYPDIPRILLTGYADKENAIRAINEVVLFQYIEKPWDNDQIKMVISNAIVAKGMKDSLKEKSRELDQALLQRDELFKREGYIREELNLARHIQEQFLPKDLPSTDKVIFEAIYKPAMEIGGDFYDIIPNGDNTWTVLLADATGHGIQAALSTALLKFAFNSFSGTSASPSEILYGMNSILRRGLPKETFVAASVLTVCAESRTCTIAAGGLPNPFLLKNGNSNIEPIPANGFLLGIAGESIYNKSEEISIHLEAEDRLILFTDGLSEAQDEYGNLFEKCGMFEKLASICSLERCEAMANLVKAAEDFCGKAEYKDDITVFGIEIK